MGTSAVVNFLDSPQGPAVASVLLHDDGYPDGEAGVLMDLNRFFSRLEEAGKDMRYLDPNVLAARYVVWLGVWESANLKKDPLALIYSSIVITPPTTNHTYFIHCYKDGLNGAGRPRVDHS